MPTPLFDVFDITLVLFWSFVAFFTGLVIYLHSENKREGYPLVSSRLNDRVPVQGWPAIPGPKTYLRSDGSSVSVPTPTGRADTRDFALRQVAPGFGSPYEPTGNPLVDGVGPASWAERDDAPEMATDGKPVIQPLALLPEFHLETRDPDPRGMPVLGADGVVAGTVRDIWVDRADSVVRYFEMDVMRDGSARPVLLPLNFCRIEKSKRRISVNALLAAQFADIPGIKATDQVTKLEEDKILGYYGGGWLYATPDRLEPAL
jgi:photosynthetic reaction center H subunit